MTRIFSVFLILFLLAGPVAAAPPGPGDAGLTQWQQALAQPHAPGEVVVIYHQGLQAAQTTPAALAGAETLARVPALGLQRYRLPAAADLAATLARLNADPAVAAAEPNYYRFPHFDPDDPLYVSYAANDAAPNGGYLNRMNMAAAWDLARGHESIVVAIIDSGLTLDHPDLAGAIWQNPGEIPGDGIDNDGNGYIDDVHGWNFAADNAEVNDWHGHGSHVGGIAGARFHNGIGIAGVAPKVKLMPLGVFALVNGRALGTWADEVEAILYAVAHGARVINLSLGSSAYSRGEQMAIEYAVQQGVVVVASAGNAGREVYGWPAAHEAAIAVAAVSASDTLASFSSRGDFVDVAAAGMAISSLSRFGGYVNNSGTSMAAPHVSGVAALILSRNPTLDPGQVRHILQTTATDLGTPGWDMQFGHGRIDAFAALLATPIYTGTLPAPWPLPDPVSIWPELCQEVVQAGDFESGVDASWSLTGAATITTTPSLAAGGEYALHLVSASGESGAAQQTLHIPASARSATLAFAAYAASGDRGWGSDPAFPGEDLVRAWLATTTGDPLLELMRGSNIGAAAAWDQTLHLLSSADLALLREAGAVVVWFSAQNDEDAAATSFLIDDVRFCVALAPLYLPLIVAGDQTMEGG